MISIDRKLQILSTKMDKSITVMILGFGSVGMYVADYLLNCVQYNFNLVVVGRNKEKLESDVNILRVASAIRHTDKSRLILETGCDFDDVEALSDVISKYMPDFILNSSRAYSGLKYGSISWSAFRAYGIWTPLSVKYIKKISVAAEQACPDSILINTSYSDAVIPWLKSAGQAYPDFGSGNLNHLIPRIKFAAAELMGNVDYRDIEVTLATAHFHDVVISKEGHTEGMPQLLRIRYKGREITNLDQKEIFARCKIPMPVDAKRNMMNASSNYDIMVTILNSLFRKSSGRLHCPGVFGEIGGYPVIIDGAKCHAYIDEEDFSLEEMRKANRQSIYFDGIENVENGELIYTNELIDKVERAFHVRIPKRVALSDSDDVAQLIIERIIKKALAEK